MAVDDVKISRKDQNNIVNNSSWIFGENSGGAQYGRTPVITYHKIGMLGSQVTNDGVNDQTNVALNADFGSFIYKYINKCIRIRFNKSC